MIKLGTIVSDKVSGAKGMLIVFDMDMDGNENYLFQPSNLNPETKLPVESFWITETRIVGGVQVKATLPIEVLGTEVTDKATGFKGTAINLSYHLNGCVHFAVKPKGIVPKTGFTIAPVDFDIRRLKGKAIKELSESELKKDREENPSPESTPQLRRY